MKTIMKLYEEFNIMLTFYENKNIDKTTRF